jgi:LuxR family maltose regulon positive regulatory protein
MEAVEHGSATPRGAADVGSLEAVIRAALRADDAALLVEIVHRSAGLLLASGGHPLLGRVLSRLGETTVADDPWLAHCSVLTRIEAGQPADRPPMPRARGRGSAGLRMAVLRSITGVFAAAAAGDLGAVPGPVDLRRSRRETPEWAALALTAAGGRAMLVDGDAAAATMALEEALTLARAHGFGCLEMQCLALLGSVAGISGDYPAMTTAAARADALATAGGWEASPLATAARWMLAYGALMRAEPVEAHRLAGDALRRGGSALRPRYVFALRSVRGAALFDAGQRRRGLWQMQQARADLGAVHLSAEQAAALAVVEHKAASELGRAAAGRDVVAWLADRVGPCGEVLLMRAWAEQAAGRDDAATALVAPVLDGTVRPVLPHTLVEALLVEASGRVSGGDVRTARLALGDALSSGASLGVIRPFALATGHARELLDEHAGGTGLPARVAAAGRPREHRIVRLDDTELRLLARLPLPLSMAQIAEELRMSPTDASTGVRAVYRKLGVSSRRSAVATAYERGLLR